MSTAKAARQPTTFITKSDLARELGVTLKTLDAFVARGTVPPPHSRPGPRGALWLRAWFDHYVRHREWPREAYPREDRAG